jgi:hypothetical protein
MKIVTGKVRASYVNVFEKKVNNLSGKEEYSMMILIPKSDKITIDKINGAIDDAVKQKWPTKTTAEMRKQFKHWPLRDGDEEKGEAPYSGHYFMNLKSSSKPGIVDANRQDILTPEEFISGDYCRVSINASPYDKSSGKGVSFYLNNVQKVANGDPLSSVSRAEDDFDTWENAKTEDWG